MKAKTKKKKLKPPSTSSSSPSDLHTAAIRIAVAQICNSVGYTGSQISALETLTDVTVRFLQSLATSAVISANSTGRTQCNLYDIIRALEHLRYDVGFTGNSDVTRQLSILTDSSILRDTMKFVYLTREIPFAKPFPIRRNCVPANWRSFVSDSDTVSRHVPRWLPEFPKREDVDEKSVAEEAGGCERRFESIESDGKIANVVSRLPEMRKKVRFRIGGGGSSGRNVNNVESGGDFRSGMCKLGKRVLCQVYDDNDDDDDDDDDEKVVNVSYSSNDEVKVKQYVRRKKKMKLLQE